MINRNSLVYRIFNVYGRGKEYRYNDRVEKLPVDICYFTRRFILGLLAISAIIFIGVTVGAISIELFTALFSYLKYGIVLNYFPYMWSEILLALGAAVGMTTAIFASIFLVGITGLIISDYIKESIKSDNFVAQRYRAFKDRVCYFVTFGD